VEILPLNGNEYYWGLVLLVVFFKYIPFVTALKGNLGSTAVSNSY